MEEALKKHDSKKVFAEIGSLTRKVVPTCAVVKDESGKVLTEMAEVLERWRGYCENLYRETQPEPTVPAPPFESISTERVPIRHEVERALEMIQKGKAAGPDEIPIELLQNGGPELVTALHELVVKIWRTGIWPQDWCESTCVPIVKKGDAKVCANYWTLSLVSHSSKILLNLILERLRGKLESEAAPEQAGFRKGRGTQNHLCCSTTMQKDLSTKLKAIIIHSLVFPVVTYGCEARTFTKEERNKLRSFETKSYRRALGRPAQFRTSNRILFIVADCEPMLEAQCWKRKLAYFGHVVRHDSMEKDIMLGMCPGNRCAGGQRRQRINDITQWLSTILQKPVSIQEAVHLAQDLHPRSRPPGPRSPSKKPSTWPRISIQEAVHLAQDRNLFWSVIHKSTYAVVSTAPDKSIGKLHIHYIYIIVTLQVHCIYIAYTLHIHYRYIADILHCTPTSHQINPFTIIITNPTLKLIASLKFKTKLALLHKSTLNVYKLLELNN